MPSSPTLSKAQDIGQVECARAGDCAFLYSSIVTLDVRATLQCGQQVEIVGRYDNYYGVRTAKGKVGYVTIDSLVILKTTPGTKPVLAPTAAPNREKLAYDRTGKPADAPSNASSAAPMLILLDSTPVQMNQQDPLFHRRPGRRRCEFRSFPRRCRG